MSLFAISPVDGRYADKTRELVPYFSESALIKYRLRVEIEYFIALCKLPLPQLQSLDDKDFVALRAIYLDFSEEDAKKVKAIEKITNHDVKAVEYFIKERFELLGCGDFKEFVHFGLTSQDVNNTAIPLLLKEVMPLYRDLINRVSKKLSDLSDEWKDVPMIAKTHGQPASPTRLGKEFRVFAERLKQQFSILKEVKYAAKFGGATGNFNAHKVAYPNTDWKNFAKRFVENTLGLHYSFPTTQIEHYDHLAHLFDTLKRINTIIIDCSRDIWQYISMNYFKQKIHKDEVGSSAMPHKVNPIDFENCEGNLGIANASYTYMSQKLPISRLQRDLTDSTVLRNIGIPIAHSFIGYKSILKGLDKLMLNAEKIDGDLEDHWSVVAEAIQTILRRENYPNPYEALKDLTRKHRAIDRATIYDFIDDLNLSETIKNELRAITPHNYTGI